MSKAIMQTEQANLQRLAVRMRQGQPDAVHEFLAIFGGACRRWLIRQGKLDPLRAEEEVLMALRSVATQIDEFELDLLGGLPAWVYSAVARCVRASWEAGTGLHQVPSPRSGGASNRSTTAVRPE